MKSKRLEKYFIKRKPVDIINIIYRSWLETEECKESQAKSDAYNKMLKALDPKQAQQFKEFVETWAAFQTQAEVQLICFVLEIVNQINNLPKVDEI